ncbi:chaperone protein dnaJ 20, chloroplastic-like [Vitis riparia]|uniref:chaperone protein dnaJ 20, chloroplastic-like n=1 Tax=Vitis riparia TaxID=96939 RepID=UPI00155AA614|nr:chaperone protein dnaJ 20, chloroplastic-like [Vitis riparia]
MVCGDVKSMEVSGHPPPECSRKPAAAAISDVGVDEIKKAYRRMALQCHPDVCLDPTTKQESTRRFMEVRKAYEMLSDPILRNMYDFEMGLVGSVCGEERRLSFNKKVWEDQLQGLARRACRRGKERKKKDTM